MPADPRSLKELFLAALAVAPADRSAWLDSECAGDMERRRHLELMLAAHDRPQSLFDQSAPLGAPMPETIGAVQTLESGAIIGPYKLLEQIGEGGMGTVWMAQQTEPVKRFVALKLIKAGLDSKQVIARFEAERQALALMDHPNIAKVFDGGMISHKPKAPAKADTPIPSLALQACIGRPYFVMELVKGMPITKYCDEHRLTPRQRLELFVPVCQAVQHAHQKGIIHRDLKPSNVLVAHPPDPPLAKGGPAGVPKVIDFGVAKAAGQPLTDKTLVTGFGNIVGTLEYMSPEQAEINQLDIDTRSDIYSLGVLLYELLAGSPPFTRKDLEKAGMLEMLRVIREQEPSKPSTKLSTADGLPTLAANRGTEPAKLTKLVRGELDWIVMKALEKDRNRRYETANGFAMDVQRYLADEPVLACPPSVVYRLRKFARRNKQALVTATLLGVALLLAVGSLGWVVRDRQATRVRTAAEVNQFLQRADSLYADNKLPEAVAEVEKARGVLEAGHGDEDLGRQVRQWLMDLDTAAQLEEIRLEGYDLEVRDDKGYADFARVFRGYGIDVQALADGEVIARVAASRIKLDLVLALGNWASRLRLDPLPQDPARWRRLLEIARAADPDPWRERLQTAVEAKDVLALREMANAADTARMRTRILAYLGDSLTRAGDREAAVAFLRKAQRQHPGDFSINANLAFGLSQLKPPPWDEVVAFRRAALAARAQSAWAHNVLGIALKMKDRLDEAILEYHEAIRLRPGFAVVHYNLGIALFAQKKYDAAIACYKKAIEFDPKNSGAHNNLGVALYAQKKLDEAIAEYRKALAIDPNFVAAHLSLGIALNDRKQFDEAIDAYRGALELDRTNAIARNNLGYALHQQKKLDEAIAEYGKALAVDPNFVLAHINLGNALSEQGKLDEAIACHKKVIDLDAKHVGAHVNIGNALLQQGKVAEAIAWHRKAIGLDPAYAVAHSGLANALRDQKKLDEAIASFRRAIELDPNQAGCHNNLGVTLYELGKVEEAVACYHKAIDLDPKEARYHFNLGLALKQQGKTDEAIASYRKAIELDPKHAGSHYSLGLALKQQGKTDEAIASYRKAIELDPKDAKFHNDLGAALQAQAELDEAIVCYRKAIELDPKNAIAYYNLGLSLEKQRKLDEAVDCFKKAVELDPKDPDAPYKLGYLLKDQNKLDEAVAWCNKAIELDPKCAKAHNVLGIALKRQNKLDEAIAAYRKAIEVDPKDSRYHYNLGLALRALQKLPEATNAYRKAIELDPKDAEAHFTLGNALHDQKKLDEAIDAYRKAIALDPKNAGAYNNLGRSLRAQHKLEEAIAAYHKAIELDAKGASRYSNLGALLCDDLMDYDKAIECFRKAIELDPKYGKAHYNLGVALDHKGLLDEAIARYRRAIKLDPRLSSARLVGALDKKGWRLINSPDSKRRDPKQALEAVKEAVELAPQSSFAWQYLGWVHYRIGNWRASIEALEKSCKLQTGVDSGQWIVLALAHAKLSGQEDLPDKEREHHKMEARRQYEETNKRIEQWWRARPGHELGQAIWDFREEARELLAAKETKK